MKIDKLEVGKMDNGFEYQLLDSNNGRYHVVLYPIVSFSDFSKPVPSLFFSKNEESKIPVFHKSFISFDSYQDAKKAIRTIRKFHSIR